MSDQLVVRLLTGLAGLVMVTSVASVALPSAIPPTPVESVSGSLPSAPPPSAQGSSGPSVPEAIPEPSSSPSEPTLEPSPTPEPTPLIIYVTLPPIPIFVTPLPSVLPFQCSHQINLPPPCR